MKVIGIYINADKSNSAKLAEQCAELIKKNGAHPIMLSGQVLSSGGSFDVESVARDTFYNDPECIIVLGGDGTLLGVARQACTSGTPLCGINIGKLGFLTSGDTNNLERIIENLCKQNYIIEERTMLDCDIIDNVGRVKHYNALNDLVVKSSAIRMVEMMVSVDGEHLDTLRADGIIVSTPTGSTGYSLAANGPVVAPNADIMLINPICPHRLHDRTYVIAGSSVATIEFEKRTRDILACMDGQVAVPLGPQSKIKIVRSKNKAKFVTFEKAYFYKRLRMKFSSEPEM